MTLLLFPSVRELIRGGRTSVTWQWNGGYNVYSRLLTFNLSLDFSIAVVDLLLCSRKLTLLSSNFEYCKLLFEKAMTPRQLFIVTMYIDH